MSAEETIPQLNHYYRPVPTLGAREAGLAVLILGDFPPLTQQEAGNEQEAQQRNVNQNQLVAWFVHKQILDWFGFSYVGTWLGVGDAVIHPNGSGRFIIERRTFTTKPWGIEFAVRFSPEA